jgi:hypothetical protein
MLGSAGAPVSAIGALSDRVAPAVEHALLATAKTFDSVFPAPRRGPFDLFAHRPSS